MGLKVIHVSDFDQKRGDIRIHRPHLFGNPFYLNRTGSNRQGIVDAFEVYARQWQTIMKAIKEIPDGTHLACYCKKPMKTHRMFIKDKPCHGDVIAKIWDELHESVSSKELHNAKTD